MTDELLMRMWTAQHSRLTADIDRLLGRAPKGRRAIDRTYARQDTPHNAASTLLSALAAIVTTAVLFGAVGVLATPHVAQAASGLTV